MDVQEKVCDTEMNPFGEHNRLDRLPPSVIDMYIAPMTFEIVCERGGGWAFPRRRSTTSR